MFVKIHTYKYIMKFYFADFEISSKSRVSSKSLMSSDFCFRTMYGWQAPFLKSKLLKRF